VWPKIAIRRLATTTDESDVIWIVIGCQTVVLRIEGSVVSPPHVRPLFSYLSFLFLVLWS